MDIFKIFSKTKNSFEGEFRDERTIKVVRMHWFVLARELIIACFLLIPILLAAFFSSYLGGVIVQRFILLVLFLILLYWWGWVFYIATMYYLNTWIITNYRLIESQQIGFFRRNYTEMSINRVQDVSVEVVGMFETFLNFGNIEVQSAGAEQKFKMLSVPEPLEVKESIMKLVEDSSIKAEKPKE